MGEEVSVYIGKIKERHNINPNSTVVPQITGKVILGLLPPSKLAFNIKMEQKTERETAEKIALEIINVALSPIKDHISELYKESDFFEKEEYLEKKDNFNQDSYREKIK